ncbi:Tfp pilus assembly protein PilV [Rubrivivax gelatinosus]|nr:Tfp pilus assembly protein PilV [Rubrivivax gelatinosus]
MSKARASSRRRQRGMALLESLVGMLVLSIAVLGSLLLLAQGTRQQHVNNGRAQVIDQLRGQIASQGLDLCGSSPTLNVNTSRVTGTTVQCRSLGNVTVTLPGDSARAVAVPDDAARVIDVQVDSPLVGGSLSLGASH